MAQRVVVTLSDDIDGGEATETVAFALDGKSYEIDLNAANAKKLRGALTPYMSAGRKLARAGRRGKASVAYHRTDVAPDPATVRAWARSHRMEVPARGRIPKRVYEAFRAAS
ncbi:Lsr2 family protein [Streptomyces sp. NBC_01754]|uniref:histone-like nucleoid-structuring protein Lsr2 n=1 Tax=Streptomyces sp. NBC_01754 TaxID=2975930 RepID=UPI002DD8F912|nr:Lsr2 family protein [Streptomyces sp. NBC_01754]WSC93824.1 Lsr2 family protein [Streptomyces sp. NBC_01754]